MNNDSYTEIEEDRDLKPLAIEGNLPLKAIGVENLKEGNPQHMPPNRYLHPWFARRPTPASRLAVLASIMPEGVSSDDLLRLMQIEPKSGLESGLAEYVEGKKATEDGRDGILEEHYGYPRPFTQSPTKSQVENLHESLRDFWGGELPKILDPTAGGGVIPFEALRYGLPTSANELNPVPSLLLKVMLRYAPEQGSMKQEIERWATKIDDIAAEELREYFPSEGSGEKPSHYACTYTIRCPECGCDIPLVKKWWLRKKSSSSGVAVQPEVSNNGSNINYTCVTIPDDVTKEEFNPQQGPHSRGGAECLNCGVVTESDTIQEQFQSGNAEHIVYGVKYVKEGGGGGFRAPTRADKEALEAAEERVRSDFELNTLLSTERYIGDEDRAGPYGVTEWRDAYTPRQLITHYEYLSAFEKVRNRIRQKNDSKTAEALLTILSLISSKAVDRNIRFAPFNTTKGYPANAVGGKHFTLQWSFVDNNLTVGNQCYLDIVDRVTDSYEELVNYLEDVDPDPATVLSTDSADLPIDDSSIQAVIIDPPYYDSIIYSEMADVFYVWLKEYLEDIHPNLFTSDLTEKSDEAVANIAEYESLEANGVSKKQLANNDYEQKMSQIFKELYRVLEPGGVMTVMFTHKESDAWDTLTKSLINSGFTITSTHPITSEMPQRTDTRGGGSADSTLLLTGRKPNDADKDDRKAMPTLWSEVRADTRVVAKEAARDLLNSGLSLTKTDVIISAFGPTLKVYADAYPVVDDQDQEVPPRRALEEAREAVTRVLVDEYLEAEKIDDLDDITEWYILSWLVHGSETFDYDDGHQLGLGIGVDIDEIKRSTKVWGKKRGDIQLKTHGDRVQDITLPPEERSTRTPVDPEALSYAIALDTVHAAMHVYKKQGEDVAIDWLKERNFETDAGFKATLKALLQVLPQSSSEWEAARDLALGRTHDALGLEFTPTDFTDASEDTLEQSELGDHS
jgi:adenine-specific DNA methylase